MKPAGRNEDDSMGPAAADRTGMFPPGVRMRDQSWRGVGKTALVILAAIVLYCTILILFGRQLEKNLDAVPHYTPKSQVFILAA